MGGIIQGYFTYYWFQDSIAPHGFFLFTHKVTSHPQSAVSINGMVGAIVNSAVSWSGNYWRERTGGRQICLGFGPWALSGVIGFACPFTYAICSGFDPKRLYTVVLFWTVWNNFFGGFASAGGGALGMDVLPTDKSTGRPSNPARDSGLQGFAGQIPNVFLPMTLVREIVTRAMCVSAGLHSLRPPKCSPQGGAIYHFDSHQAAFNTFFVVGGVISIISWWMLALCVHPPNEKPGRRWQCTRHWCHGEGDPWYEAGGVFESQENPRVAARLAREADPARSVQPPLGARLCDQVHSPHGLMHDYLLLSPYTCSDVCVCLSLSLSWSVARGCTMTSGISSEPTTRWIRRVGRPRRQAREL
jgi:hypothetical protein